MSISKPHNKSLSAPIVGGMASLLTTHQGATPKKVSSNSNDAFGDSDRSRVTTTTTTSDKMPGANIKLSHENENRLLAPFQSLDDAHLRHQPPSHLGLVDKNSPQHPEAPSGSSDASAAENDFIFASGSSFSSSEDSADSQSCPSSSLPLTGAPRDPTRGPPEGRQRG